MLLGCGRREPTPAPEARDERRSSTPSAFDLVPTAGGAALVWAGGMPPALHLEPLDAAGHVLRHATSTLASGEGVADVAVVARGGAHVIAWSEAAAGERRLRAAWVPESGPARRFELGAVGSDAPVARGGVALAASGQGARLFARGGPTACAAASAAPCRAFQFFAIEPDQARPLGLALAVPSPCASQAAQLVPGVSGRALPGGTAEPFEYAVCSAARDSPALTVFSIRPDPAYAMAEEVFAGCTPLGAARFAGAAAFVALCGSERRVARLARDAAGLSIEVLEPRGLVCGAAGANVRLGAGWLRLSEPMGGLELLLGEDLAPPGSRAVWTGSALLVARPTAAGELLLQRHACRGTALVELGAEDAGP